MQLQLTLPVALWQEVPSSALTHPEVFLLKQKLSHCVKQTDADTGIILGNVLRLNLEKDPRTQADVLWFSGLSCTNDFDLSWILVNIQVIVN